MKPYFNKRQGVDLWRWGVILWRGRVVIQPKLRAKILQKLQQTHLGIVHVNAIARSNVWWPNLNIKRTCRTCMTRVLVQNKAPIHCWEYPGQPCERIYIMPVHIWDTHVFDCCRYLLKMNGCDENIRLLKPQLIRCEEYVQHMGCLCWWWVIRVHESQWNSTHFRSCLLFIIRRVDGA